MDTQHGMALAHFKSSARTGKLVLHATPPLKSLFEAMCSIVV